MLDKYLWPIFRVYRSLPSRISTHYMRMSNVDDTDAISHAAVSLVVRQNIAQ